MIKNVKKSAFFYKFLYKFLRARYKMLREVIRIEICERLVTEWYHINVQAAAEAS